jgi:hypothetical protein
MTSFKFFKINTEEHYLNSNLLAELFMLRDAAQPAFIQFSLEYGHSPEVIGFSKTFFQTEYQNKSRTLEKLSKIKFDTAKGSYTQFYYLLTRTLNSLKTLCLVPGLGQ